MSFFQLDARTLPRRVEGQGPTKGLHQNMTPSLT
jgi:hypothetical protein